MAKRRASRPARPTPRARSGSDREHVARHPHGVVIARGDEVILLGPDGPPVAMRVGDPWSFEAVLRACVQPVPVQELASTSQLKEAVDLLVEAGILMSAASVEELRRALDLVAATRPVPVRVRSVCRRLVVGATGAIQTMNLPDLLFAALVGFADSIDVVLTEAAARFVARDALVALGARVWTGPAPTENVAVPHVDLSQADLVLITPASAACLHRIASGSCSDLLSLIVAMTRSPVIVVPAMNENMWSNPAIVRNARQAVYDGHYVVLPGRSLEVSELGHAAATYGGMGVPEHRVPVVLAAVLEHARSSRH